MIQYFQLSCLLFAVWFLTVDCTGSSNSDRNHKLAKLSVQKSGDLPVILTWDYNIFVMGEEEISKFVESAKERNISQINLRINNKGAMNVRIDHGRVYSERLDAFGNDFDPLKALVKECHKQGIKAGVHFDLFESSYDDFFINNPQFTPQNKKDTIVYNAFPCYAHEETREYMLNRVRDLTEYGVDKIFFCTKSSHTPRNMTEVPRNSYAAYNPPIIERYREKFGVDILTEEPEKENVARIHGEYLVKFLLEAKKILGKKGIESIAGATLSGYLQPSGKNIYLDWKDIIDSQAADALTMSNTRGETFAWYEEGAPEQFMEIAQQVKGRGMEFYGYILSTVFWDIRDRFSSADMLEFISDQMDYFNRMGADAVLIHEVYQKEIWDVLGNWEINQGNAPDDSKVIIPPGRKFPSIPHQVPCGGFEEEKSYWFWDVVPGWLSVTDWLPGRNTASGLNAEDFHKLWTADTGGNQYLHAEYDWKVMANSDFSGRSFSGRSSILLYADPEAGSQSNRTVSWSATSGVPVLPKGRYFISAQNHGEDLEGIEASGIKVRFRDEGGNIISEVEEKETVSGTFPWKSIRIPFEFPVNTYEIEVTLYMTVKVDEKTGGRLWFDKFQILSESFTENRELEIHESDEAPEGNRYAGLNVVPGVEIISMPFRWDSNDGVSLELTARTESRNSMTVEVELDSVTSRIQLTDQWQRYYFDLEKRSTPSVAGIKIRPLNSGMLYLDKIMLHKSETK